MESVCDAGRRSGVGAIVQIGRRSHWSRGNSDSHLELQRRFNGDSAILGKTIRLNGRTYTVIGVLPDWFQYPDPKIQLWVPWQIEEPPVVIWSHYIHIGHVAARLGARASGSAALQEISALEYELYTRLRGAGPMEQGVIAKPLLEDMVDDVRTPLYVLLAAVVRLLLIASLNLSNLLVARSAARRREMAIRSALGSSRLLIWLAGGALGLMLSVGATKWLIRHWTELPREYDVHADGLGIGFALGITLLAAVLAGLLPAISSTRRTVLAAMQEGSRGMGGSVGRASLRKALLAPEVALTVVLLMRPACSSKAFYGCVPSISAARQKTS